MFICKKITKCRTYTEVEIYQTIRKPGKYYGGRGINRSLSSDKQKKANQIRTERKWAQIIDVNWTSDDWFCRFSAPFGTFDSEEKFRREIKNWFARIKRKLKKQNIEFKYLGFIECGKLGKNWHIHIIFSDEIMKIAKEEWKYKNGGMNFTPLYEEGCYEKLAKYIRKDITTAEDELLSERRKRMMASKNLKRPAVVVRPASKADIKNLMKGQKIDAPKGYYYVEDDYEQVINDVTGAKWYFKFRKLKN